MWMKEGRGKWYEWNVVKGNVTNARGGNNNNDNFKTLDGFLNVTMQQTKVFLFTYLHTMNDDQNFCNGTVECFTYLLKEYCTNFELGKIIWVKFWLSMQVLRATTQVLRAHQVCHAQQVHRASWEVCSAFCRTLLEAFPVSKLGVG